MKVYNEEKTIELEEYDLDLGHLEQSTLTIHHEAVPFIERVVHYETIREYPNGGRDVAEIVDVEGQEEKEAYDETEDILVYIPYTEEELAEKRKDEIRQQREYECFPIINRGAFWYDTLTTSQKDELRLWYHAWLDAPETGLIPERPTWLEDNNG